MYGTACCTTNPQEIELGGVWAYRVSKYVLDTALLEWISEYAVRACTTADSVVSYLYHARIA